MQRLLSLCLLLIFLTGPSSGRQDNEIEVETPAADQVSPLELPAIEATVHRTHPNPESQGQEVTPRRILHIGTYPVSAPPELARSAGLRDLYIPINVAPKGGPLGPEKASDTRGAPEIPDPGDEPYPQSSPEAPAEGPLSPPPAPEPQATCWVEGVFQYEDRELIHSGFTGVTWMAPIRSADVEYFDVGSGEVLGTTSTNETGFFRMQITDTLTRNVSFRALTTSWQDPGLFNASVTQLPSQGGQRYALTSPVYPNHDPSADISFVTQPVNATMDSVGGPFHLFDLAESAERYVENLTSASPTANLTVYWSRGYDEGKYYDTYGHVYLPATSSDDDSYDDNVILHEIGHYIALSYSADAGYYGAHSLAGIYDIRLTYTEGLGSYFMGAIRNFLNVSQPLIYIETNGTALSWWGFSLSFDTDTPSGYSDGSLDARTAANEVSVGHALYDAVDGVTSEDGTTGTDDDTLDLGFLVGDELVWDVLVSIKENASLFTKRISMETFYDQWLLVNPGYATEFTQILLAHGIEYAPDAYEADDTFLSATTVLPDGVLHHHTFYPAGDEDWLVLAAVPGEEYVIKTQDLLDGADTVLELYDSDGTTLLDSNNNRDASTLSSLLRVVPTIPQQYYVRTFRYAETPMPIGEYGKYNLTVYILPNPKITSVTPSTGPVNGGTSVTIAGSNFTAGATVLFGVYEATGVTVVDGNTITATTPANVPGGVNVTVRNLPNPDGLIPQGTLPGGFTYTGTALPPIIGSITPNFGTSSVSTNVTVAGDYFVSGATLMFDAILSASYTVVDPKTIRATVQPLPVAVYDVVVTNPNALFDVLTNGFESTSTVADVGPVLFDDVSPLSRAVSVTDDFEIMDLYVYANVTHPETYWGGVRLELESPSGKIVSVYDRILVADSTGTTWRTRINATFGYDEAPSEVLWQFRGERTAGTWTLHLSATPMGASSTLHSWAIYFFKHRHQDVSRIVLAAAYYRNYVTGFDEVTGNQLYRVRLQSNDPNRSVPYPITVAVTRDQTHACGGGYSDYNNTRGGWTDSAVTCFELMTGKPVQLFYFSGNLQIDGLEAAGDADRMVAATNEVVYRINTTTLQIEGSVPTGFPPSAPIPHLGVTPDGRKAYVTNENGQYVIVVDLDALVVLGQIDVPGYFPLDVDFTRDGTFGYISTSEAPSAFHRFDPTTDTIVDVLPISSLRPVQAVLTPDGSKAFYTHYQWYAGSSRKNLTTGAETGVQPHPESTTVGLAMSRGGTLYIADWYIQRIWVYNASTEVLEREIPIPDRVYPTGIDVGEVVKMVVLSGYGGNGYTNLSWSTPFSYGTPVQGYRIYRGNASGEEENYTTVGVVNAYIDLGVINGQTYYYRVAAFNGAGEGAWSNEVSATPNVYFPQITSLMASPDPQMTGGNVNLTATVTDLPPISQVWVNVSDPGSGWTNSSMARVGTTDEFYFNGPYTLVGVYSFAVWAVNADGNGNGSGASGFTVIADTEPPEITNVSADPDPQAVGGYVNLTARVVDSVAVSTVWANVTLIGGGWANTSMTRVAATDDFYHNTSYSLPGPHGYTIWANDATGNLNSSSGYSFTIIDVTSPLITGVGDTPDPQDVAGWVNITANVTDNIQVYGVFVTVSFPGGGSMNMSMGRVGATDEFYYNTTYAASGIHNYTIWANDTDGNWNASFGHSFTIVPVIIPDVTPPEIVGVMDFPDPQGTGSAVNVTASVTDDVSVIGVSVNISIPGGGSFNASMNRIGTTDTYYYNQTHVALGSYPYRIWAGDSSGNMNSSSGHSFTIGDSLPPQISGVMETPDPQDVGGLVNITAAVTDNVQVGGVWANMTLPGGAYFNASMTRIGVTNTYYFEQPYGTLGTFAYRVVAEDSSGNWAAPSSSSFSIVDRTFPIIANAQASPDPQDVGGSVNITALVTDNVGLLEVRVNVTQPVGGSLNISMVQVGLTAEYYYEAPYGTPGTVFYRIWARDTSGNSQALTDYFLVVDRWAPEITTAKATPAVQEIHGNVNVSVNVTDNYALFPTVWLHLVDPLGAVTNQTMVRGTGDGWFLRATYVVTGTYSFTIWARDTVGNWNSASSSFQVRDTTAPVAVAGADLWVLTGEAVPFDGSASQDNSGESANLTWRISRGNTLIATMYGSEPSFTFPTSGDYTVTLAVRDASGNIGQDSLTVTVRDPEVSDGENPGIPLVLWTLLILAIVSVILLGLYLYRKKRKNSPSDSASTDGTERP